MMALHDNYSDGRIRAVIGKAMLRAEAVGTTLGIEVAEAACRGEHVEVGDLRQELNRRVNEAVAPAYRELQGQAIGVVTLAFVLAAKAAIRSHERAARRLLGLDE